MKKLYFIYIISFTFFTYTISKNLSQYDLTIVGPIKFADGLAGIATGAISCLEHSLNINTIPTSLNFTDMPDDISKVISKPYGIAKVVLFTDLLWTSLGNSLHLIPKQSIIKIAYSMLEANSIPPMWTYILNTQFDAVVVPDKFLVNIYLKCGVKIPIFVLPCCLHLEEFLNRPLKTKQNKEFNFGVSAGFGPDKNLELLLEAFAQEFGNTKDVKLNIHGRAKTDNLTLSNLISLIAKYNLNNVNINTTSMSRLDYINYMSNLDCYVLLSRGEGFSITSREALALGIPCILSNNTAHQTICNTGLVNAVKSNKLVLADYQVFGNFKGYKFDCSIADARLALRNVYENYDFYLQKGHEARQWVKQYLPLNLKNRYMNLIKPKQIVYGAINGIFKDYLMTNSPALYKKYRQMLGS